MQSIKCSCALFLSSHVLPSWLLCSWTVSKYLHFQSLNFWRARLPLACTWWVRSAFLSLCCQLLLSTTALLITSATSQFKWKIPTGIEPRGAGLEVSMLSTVLNLCHLYNDSRYYFPRNTRSFTPSTKEPKLSFPSSTQSLKTSKSLTRYKQLFFWRCSPHPDLKLL